ncbi:MAG: hypothetical protein AAFY22_06505 [Pseudomonadota bacterium]
MSAPRFENETHAASDFDAARAARYRRLSLLTLDLAEEAGEGARHFSFVDAGPADGKKPGRFERRIAAMTRAIWAHRAIEAMRRRLENGEDPRPVPRAAKQIAQEQIAQEFGAQEFGAQEQIAREQCTRDMGAPEFRDPEMRTQEMRAPEMRAAVEPVHEIPVQQAPNTHPPDIGAPVYDAGPDLEDAALRIAIERENAGRDAPSDGAVAGLIAALADADLERDAGAPGDSSQSARNGLCECSSEGLYEGLCENEGAARPCRARPTPVSVSRRHAPPQKELPP